MKKSSADKMPHLLVKGTAHTESYTSPQQGGSKFKVPDRDRKTHGTKLLNQLEQLREEAQELKTEQTAFGVDVDNGILLQFESEPDFKLRFYR